MGTSTKIHRVLNLFLISFLAILLRVWHLGVIQREEKLVEAQKPQQRTILVRAPRGTIYDRFRKPMAENKISYNAAIYYAQIAEIPIVEWRDNIKIYARKEYIRNLSLILGKTLQLDPERIEDLIHSKAALFPHAPFILKGSLTEEEHYRLRMLEKDWPGISAEIASLRSYPMGKTGCHLIGTMGAINQKEYTAIAQELTELQLKADLFESADLKRLQELKEKAYSINDLVGKTGIEAQFESELRGFFGKKTFEVDQKGRFIRELASKEVLAGKEIVLSISAELQRFAEQLLANNEKTREGRSFGIDPTDKTRKMQKQPWIKGGAIIALDPKNGEILAMASHPCFDPNDFIFTTGSIFNDGKTRQVGRWLESERYIGAVWDGLEELKRDNVKEESAVLTWDFYLDQILPLDSSLRAFFKKMDTVKGAIQLQEDMEAMLYFTENRLPIPTDIQKRLDATALSQQDRLFAADLCRTAVYAPAFTDELIQKVGQMKIADYRALCQAFLRKNEEMKRRAEEEFHQTEWRAWKDANQKSFLAEKRRSEKEHKTWARPYIEYLDRKEKELFEAFWEQKKSLLDDLSRTFRSYSELKRPLLGKYKALRGRKHVQTEKEMAAAFYPIGGFGFGRSYAFETSSPQGSIFKLVTAYEALRQGKQLTLIDQLSPHGVAFTLSQNLYPRFYKRGRLPRSANPNIGKVDLLGAIEQTSNPYFSILAGDYFNQPEDLAEAAKCFGFGEKTGVELPREKKGNIPDDLAFNRTGLYSTAIGQHTLLTTPLQTAVMLAAIANGGKLLKPKLVKEIVGFHPDRNPLVPFAAQSYFAKKELQAIGIHFPLFTATQKEAPVPETGEIPTVVRRTVPMDGTIRETLIEAMARVVSGAKGTARPSVIRSLLKNPIAMQNYLALQPQLIGKTGTAEIVCNLSCNPSSPPQVYKHIWFGGISFTDAKKSDPELVVVVFLRFGDGGKEAAPLAAQMIHKWREIQKRHGQRSEEMDKITKPL